MRFLIFLIFLTAAGQAREWHAVEGGGTLGADFAGLKEDRVLLRQKGGRSLVLPLRSLGKDDQEFARLAQVSLNGAQVLGPQTFEVQCVVDGGSMVRMGTRLQGGKGPWLFIGETFFLPVGGQKLERGDRLESKLLYYAGNRTYQPLEGDPVVLRAFALDLDEAVNAGLRIRLMAGADPAKLAPVVAEPLVELVSQRTIALPVGKGLYVTEAEVLKDAKTLVLHEQGRDLDARVVKVDGKLGLALVSCAHEMEPLRLLPRDPLEVGQDVFAVSLPVTDIRKKLASPILTRGIVSKAGSGGSFQHDAAISPQAIGGYILTSRWEVAGVFFRPASRVETVSTAKPKPVTSEAPAALTECLHTRALDKMFMEGEKDKPRRMSGVPALRSGSLGDEPAEVISLLRKGTALIVATHEVMKSPPPRQAAAAAAGAPPPAGGAQFSLSGSGTRHNARCRYFNAAKACQATEGSPCKVCGG